MEESLVETSGIALENEIAVLEVVNTEEHLFESSLSVTKQSIRLIANALVC